MSNEYWAHATLQARLNYLLLLQLLSAQQRARREQHGNVQMPTGLPHALITFLWMTQSSSHTSSRLVDPRTRRFPRPTRHTHACMYLPLAYLTKPFGKEAAHTAGEQRAALRARAVLCVCPAPRSRSGPLQARLTKEVG